MRQMILAVIVAAACSSGLAAECVGSRCRVAVTGGAQAHADRLASSGIEIRGGQIAQRHHAVGVGREGLGFSTRSPQDAIERSCMYGRYPVREQATAWCPSRRGWVAVVRYGR